MILRDDMVDLEREPVARLRNLAVFAAITRPLPDEFLERAIHACLISL